MGKKYLAINMMASIINLLMNLAFNFLLTSFLVKNVGIEANGFISLANTLVGYATIITVALNSVAGRFVSIYYHKGDTENSNKFFNSSLAANLVFAIFFIILALLIAPNIQCFFDVPPNLVWDVKILFFLVFINYSILIISTIFSVAMFVTNKLYITNVINAVGLIFRGLLCLILYSILPPTIIYVGLITALISIGTLYFNYYFFRKILNDFNINIRSFSWQHFLIMIRSGIWSSISSLSNNLNDGLSLIISNIFINSVVMGQLSIAKTLSNILNTILSNITNVFAPNLTYLYAKEDKSNFFEEITDNMYIVSFFGGVIFTMMLVLGKDFIGLWIPSQDKEIIYNLLFLVIFSFFNSPVTNTLYNIFLITNNLKINSLFWLVISIFDTLCLVILLKNTNLGIYAIAGFSTFVGFICNFTFIPIFAAKCVNAKWNYFLPIVFKYFFVTLALNLVCFFIKQFFIINTWSSLILTALLFGIIAVCWNFIFFINKRQKKELFLYIAKFKRR